MKLSAFLLLSALSSAAMASPQQSSDGIYTTSKISQLSYHVDSKTQLCFASSDHAKHPTLLQIDCTNLAKRSEWKDVITWLDKPMPNEHVSYRPHR